MKIYPANPFSGRFSCPADKSETLRSLLLSALTEGEKTIDNPLIAEDTLSMAECLKKLGAEIRFEDGKFFVRGAADLFLGETLDCGNSATTLRLLVGALSGLGVKATFTGDESLKSRDFSDVITPLTEAGAVIESNNGFLPITLKKGITKPLYAETTSAQVKGGVLLAGLFGKQKATVNELAPMRDVTERLLTLGGANIVKDGDTLTLDGGEVAFEKFTVGGDFSSAAFFLTLGLLRGVVTVTGVNLAKNRTGFLDVLSAAGANFKIVKTADNLAEVTAYRSKIKAFITDGDAVGTFVDEVPLLALIAAFSDGETRIKGLGKLRNKETDRLSGIAELVNLAGGSARVEGDDLVIVGTNGLKGGFNYSSIDHRMTMAATISMLVSEKGGEIHNEKSVAVSFPDFFDKLFLNSFALIGEDVTMSLSFLAHKITLDKYLFNYCFSCVSLDENSVENFIEKSPYKSINVTNPYKIKAYELMEKLNRRVPKIKSVNLVSRGAGYNTDLSGMELFLNHEDYSFKDKNVLVYGSGGVARSVVTAFHDLGTNVFVTARNMQKVDEMLAELPFFTPVEGDNGSYEVLANASTLGRVFAPGCPFSIGAVACSEYVFDVNYEPVHTELLCLADDFGVKHSGGLKLLFYQALITDGLYLSVDFDRETADKYYKEFLIYYENFARKRG